MVKACIAGVILAMSPICVHGASQLHYFRGTSATRLAESIALRNGVVPGQWHESYVYNWTQAYFPQFVDQFSYAGSKSNNTYPQRYLINSASWGGPGYPIFFYCGNEGFIELFANNTGLVWELAPTYKALVVFAEHRYYGLSLPFGNSSYEMDKLNLLSIEQALADFSNLLASLQANLSASTSPVVAFGGSYGGMLAAWFRMRYPNVVVGSIASSAPILQIPGIMDPGAYNAIITNDFRQANPNAPQVLYNTFQQMIAVANAGGQAERDTIKENLGICNPLNSADDVWNAVYYITGALGFMAMADYPYPASFLGPMPAWPVNVSAASLNLPNAPFPQLLQQVAAGPLSVFYNYTGQAGPCYNLTQSSPPGLQGNGWGVQCCREVVQPIGSYGLPNDFFWSSPFNATDFALSCEQQFDGLVPRPYLQLRLYGDAQLRGASNMVLTSGSLDPWLSGDVSKNSSFTDDVTVYIIAQGAHHLDLRASDPADPPSVIEARQIEQSAMNRWIAAHYVQTGMHEVISDLGLENEAKYAHSKWQVLSRA